MVGAGPYDKPAVDGHRVRPWSLASPTYVHGYGPLPEPAAWRLAAGLAEALLAVHACGLVHRDLKPSNVLLAVDGPRVIDFGIASALEVTGLTTTGSVMGSPPYMSPEQAMGMPTGPASDVFALGSTLAFAAGGAPPFGDGEAHALLFRVVHMAPALDNVPERLRGVVAACLAKDPAARPTLPQLLRACQDGAAAGGNSAASFWPRQMTAAIAGHQAGSIERGRRPTGRCRPADGSVRRDSSCAGGQRVPPGRRPSRPFPSAGRPGGPRSAGPARWPAPSAAAGCCPGLGGLVVAGGLAAAGWELAGSGSSPAEAGTTAGNATGNRVAWTFKADGRCAPAPRSAPTARTSTSAATRAPCTPSTRPPASRSACSRSGGAVSGVTMASGNTLLVGSADGTVSRVPDRKPSGCTGPHRRRRRDRRRPDDRRGGIVVRRQRRRLRLRP